MSKTCVWVGGRWVCLSKTCVSVGGRCVWVWVRGRGRMGHLVHATPRVCDGCMLRVPSGVDRDQRTQKHSGAPSGASEWLGLVRSLPNTRDRDGPAEVTPATGFWENAA